MYLKADEMDSFLLHYHLVLAHIGLARTAKNNQALKEGGATFP